MEGKEEGGMFQKPPPSFSSLPSIRAGFLLSCNVSTHFPGNLRVAPLFRFRSVHLQICRFAHLHISKVRFVLDLSDSFCYNELYSILIKAQYPFHRAFSCPPLGESVEEIA